MNAETELDKAYRAIYAFYNARRRREPLSDVVFTYHSPTIAAASRWVRERKMDGAEYFVGKPVEVLHAALKAEQ